MPHGDHGRIIRYKNIEFVVITLDPENDTPEVLKKFQDHMGLDRHWHFLAGSNKDTRLLANNLGLGDYWKFDDHIMHGFKILILDPSGNILHTLDWDHRTMKDVLKNKT